jgi:Tfp pilus assembly protein PilF
MHRLSQNSITAIAGLMWVLLPAVAHGQRGLDLPTFNPNAPTARTWMCHVAGRVTTPHRDPVAGARVSITLQRSKRPLVIETGIQGDFRASFPAGSDSRQIEIVIEASREGFLDGQDTIELARDHEAPPAELVLQRARPDPQLLSWDSLIAALMPRLRTPTTGAALVGVQLKHFQLGLRLLDQDNPADASPVLRSVANHDPTCIECFNLAALAALASGAWQGAATELNQAARLAALAQGQDRRMEPFVTLGVLQTWRGELTKAQISLLQALALKADDPLALCELGRAFLLQGKMATADLYLARALTHGAPEDAHLLRAQALSELGKPREAQNQLDAYLNGRKARQLPDAPRALYTELGERIALASGGDSSAMMDRSPAELMKTLPELKDLKPDEDQSDLASTMQKVGESVRSVFQGLPDTSSHEKIEMERLHPDGKRAGSLDQQFEYLAVNATNEDGLQLSEYRTDKSGHAATPGDGDGNFMVTKGFAADPLIFYPDWQEGSRYRLMGRQQLDGRDTLVIAFAERPAKAKMLEEFRIRGQSIVVLVQGLAWVDATTYRILRMRTELLKPAPEIRLDAQITDVRFAEVRFTANDEPFWLPQEVSVLVRWNGRIYRNQHHYSDYAVFQVKTRQHVKAPKAPAGAGSDANDDGGKQSHSGSGTD